MTMKLTSNCLTATWSGRCPCVVAHSCFLVQLKSKANKFKQIWIAAVKL